MLTIANKEAPVYLQELVQHVNERVSHSKLRSSDSNTFIKPRTWTKFAERTFPFAGTAVWNVLPAERHFQVTSSDPLFQTWILTLLDPFIEFQISLFYCSLIRCTALLDIYAQWHTTIALLLLFIIIKNKSKVT